MSSPVCKHVCTCLLHVTFTMLTCGDQRTALGVFHRHYLTLFYETQPLLTWNPPAKHKRLSSEPLGSARLHLLSWDYKHTPPCLTFYTGTGDLNLCLHACSVSILPAEPSPQPWGSIFCTLCITDTNIVSLTHFSHKLLWLSCSY